MMDLTLKEIQVLQGMAEGKTNSEIADAANRSVKTIEKHRSNLLAKLETRTSGGAVAIGFRQGIIR